MTAAAVLLASLISSLFAFHAAASNRLETRTLAQEERRQARIQEAYLTLFVYLEKWERYAQWAAQVYVFSDDEPELPELNDAGGGIAALVASKPVEAAMEEFDKLLIAFRRKKYLHQAAVNGHVGITSANDVDPVDRAEAQLQESVKALSGQVKVVFKLMREELAADEFAVVPKKRRTILGFWV